MLPNRALLGSLLATVLLIAFPAPAAALPTPGVNCDISEPVVGRIFPEAMDTNDFVSFREAECGFAKLAEAHPDRIRVQVAGESAGWQNHVTGQHDKFNVYVIEVSNFASTFNDAQKVKVVFQLSIHGNEKGGREGGLRVIEDLTRGIGMAEAWPELVPMLDYMMLVFVFPNPDGWVHEENEYRANDACYFSATCAYGSDPNGPGAETQNFVRVNGNGKDINRNWPTVGWVHEPYTPMSESESTSLVNWLLNYTNVAYASDIHGMLTPADAVFPGQAAAGMLGPALGGGGGDASTARGHFVLTMLPAGRQSPGEMLKTTALAALIKERLNGDPYFAEWQASQESLGVWGGEFNDWGTVWDTLSYTDSGFTSDWYAQDHGLNAPGVDFELAYNHITFDNYYPGIAQRFNDYHVQCVRQIVRAFMEHAAKDIQLSIDTKGTRTAFLTNPKVLTNAGNLAVSGWAKENPNDDRFDSAHRVWEAAPNDYFTDLKPYLRNGDQPGVLDGLRASDLNANTLSRYDRLVIAGSAWEEIQGNAAAKAAVKTWVERGGKLFVTDQALQMLPDLGVVAAGSVDRFFGYAGYANFMKRDSPVLANVRGLARETYEPVPLGYGVNGLNAPVWFVKADKYKGDVIGVGGTDQAGSLDLSKVVLGSQPLGSGEVAFLGAFLPDPTAEFYHPYGLDSYATTYTANQILRNVLGWDETFQAPPVLSPETGQLRPIQNDGPTIGARGGDAGASKGVPAPGLLAGVAVALAAARALSRRRAP